MSGNGQTISVFQRPRPADRAHPVDLSATTRRVIVQETTSDWQRALTPRLEQLVRLPRGWDGYRGRPISYACATFAGQILVRLCRSDLAPPALVPGSDGSIQIEWHENGYDVELDVQGPNHVIGKRFDLVAEEDEEIELSNDFTRIIGWIDALAAERPEWHHKAA